MPSTGDGASAESTGCAGGHLAAVTDGEVQKWGDHIMFTHDEAAARFNTGFVHALVNHAQITRYSVCQLAVLGVTTSQHVRSLGSNFEAVRASLANTLGFGEATQDLRLELIRLCTAQAFAIDM